MRSDAMDRADAAPPAPPAVDVEELRSKVRDVYRQVAETPDGEFHFEMAREA